jgi:hypothetical protein
MRDREGLTEAMLRELRHLDRMTGPSYHIKFRTGEALRRRGLAERYTYYVVGADWANEDGVHEQYRHTKPRPLHEWSITPAGSALAKEEGSASQERGNG